MEIYKCLDDIITRVEQEQEPKIIKARTYTTECVVLIDLNKLKANPRLNGAKIFKMLFGISKNASFAKLPMKTDRNGHITLLSDLQINLETHRFSNFTGAMLWHQSLQASKFMSKWIEEKNK